MTYKRINQHLKILQLRVRSILIITNLLKISTKLIILSCVDIKKGLTIDMSLKSGQLLAKEIAEQYIDKLIFLDSYSQN